MCSNYELFWNNLQAFVACAKYWYLNGFQMQILYVYDFWADTLNSKP